MQTSCKGLLPVCHNNIVDPHPEQEGERKKKFAVCVKGLDFPSEDISVRLVEWIEMLNILGADKVGAL